MADLSTRPLADRPIEGRWWFPEFGTKRFDGVLRLEANHHGTLTINGDCGVLEEMMFKRDEQTVYGQGVLQSPSKVTVFRAVPTSFMQSPRAKTAELALYTNGTLIGAHVSADDVPAFTGASIRLTGLDQWCDTSGFSAEHTDNNIPFGKAGATLSYCPMHAPLIQFTDGATFQVKSHYDGPMFFNNIKEINMKESSTVELTFRDKHSINDVLREIGIWQSLLTFSLRQASYVRYIALSHPPRHARCILLLPTSERAPERKLSTRNMLTNRSALSEGIADFVARWRSEFSSLDIPLSLLSSLSYQDSLFTYTRILALLQAIEVLHRERFVGQSRFPDKQTARSIIQALRKALPSDLDPKLTDALKAQLSFVGELTLLDRLKHLYGLYRESIKPLFPDYPQDLELLRDVRNYLTHYGRKRRIDPAYVWSTPFSVLTDKTQLFLEVCVLGALGKTDIQILGMLQRFEPYLLVQGEQHRP